MDYEESRQDKLRKALAPLGELTEYDMAKQASQAFAKNQEFRRKIRRGVSIGRVDPRLILFYVP